MRNEQIEPTHNYTIYQWMIDELKLKGFELNIYALFYSFHVNGKDIYMSHDYICKRVGMTRKSCFTHVGKLEDKGIIKRLGSQGKVYQYEILKTCVNLTQVNTSANAENGKEENQTCVNSTQVKESNMCNSYTTHVSNLHNTCVNLTHNSKSISKVNSKGRTYGIYDNVNLTDIEFQKLKNNHPEDYSALIDNLSLKLHNKGYVINDHYGTIEKWAKEDNKKVGESMSMKYTHNITKGETPKNDKQHEGYITTMDELEELLHG